MENPDRWELLRSITMQVSATALLEIKTIVLKRATAKNDAIKGQVQITNFAAKFLNA